MSCVRVGVRSRIASSCSVSVAWCAEFEVLGVSCVVVCRLVVRHPAARCQLTVTWCAESCLISVHGISRVVAVVRSVSVASCGVVASCVILSCVVSSCVEWRRACRVSRCASRRCQWSSQSRPAAARRQSHGVRSRAASPCTMSVSSCARRQSRRADWPRREESRVVASCVIASRVVSSNCIDAAFRTITA